MKNSLSASELNELQKESETCGKQCVVGAVIVNQDNRVFIQKRTTDRRIFPNTWDIVGGHVEENESLFGALSREIQEETGWTLKTPIALIHIHEWMAIDNGQSNTRREYDFITSVNGDLALPQIENDKVSEYKWIDQNESKLLLYNRSIDDRIMYEIIVHAFDWIYERE